MTDFVSITSIEFVNYKAFRHFSSKLQHMNIFVGPNNCGKSTIIGALRILDIAIRQAGKNKASRVKGPDGPCFGYSIPVESIPISIENIHTEYEEIDTYVHFHLSNGNDLILSFPKDGGCYLLTKCADKMIITPGSFSKNFPMKIEIVPVLGPLEHDESILTEETVRRGRSTHRASRHFRNYWYHYPNGFEDFAALVEKTWPGMKLLKPERRGYQDYLDMFCLENRITREMFWSGFGFQIWCQLLTHIYRCGQASLLVIDEPEIYLHPDVQRQLIGILRDAGPDIIIATHSSEIMGEADPSDILLINKDKRKAERLRDIDGIQKALDLMGSIQNITLTQLARTKRLLFVESDFDGRLIRRFAKRLGLNELSLGNDITFFESGGFSTWKKIKSFVSIFKQLTKTTMHVGLVNDRDYFCEEEISDISKDLKEDLGFIHTHQRKEIENYLIIPNVLDRVIQNAIIDRAKRNQIKPVTVESINKTLEDMMIEMKKEVQAQYISKRSEYLKHSGKDNSTITKETLTWFEDKWSNFDTRLEIVPGKEVLSRLRTFLQDKYGIGLTEYQIINEIKISEIPKDLHFLLSKLEEFRHLT